MVLKDWLPIIISVLSLLGIGTLMGSIWKSKLEVRKNNKEEVLERKRLEKQEEMRSVLREELKPLIDDIAEMKESEELNKKATVSCLRSQMKAELNDCKQKGFATSSEKANWNQLYADYVELGGNHFKEYVDQWKLEIEKLPTEKRTRKTLNENNK